MVAVRLAPSSIARLDAAATTAGVTRSDLIRAILKRALNSPSFIARALKED